MKETKKSDIILSVILIACLFGIVMVLDRTLSTTGIAMTVLKKCCIYSLIAVSMNLVFRFSSKPQIVKLFMSRAFMISMPVQCIYPMTASLA